MKKFFLTSFSSSTSPTWISVRPGTKRPSRPCFTSSLMEGSWPSRSRIISLYISMTETLILKLQSTPLSRVSSNRSFNARWLIPGFDEGPCKIKDELKALYHETYKKFKEREPPLIKMRHKNNCSEHEKKRIKTRQIQNEEFPSQPYSRYQLRLTSMVNVFPLPVCP